MKPANYCIELYKGSTYTKGFTWSTQSTATPSADPIPVDITDCSIKMQVRASINDSTVLAEFSTANGSFLITDAAAGKFKLDIPAAMSSAWAFTEGVFDIEITMSDLSTTYRIVKGYFKAYPEVTR